MTRNPRFVCLPLLILAGFLAYFIERTLPPPTATNDPLSRILGSAKEIIGDSLYLKADVYFHGGAEHHEEERSGGLREEGFIAEEHEEEHKAQGGMTAADDWIRRINRQVHFEKHYHLTKEEQKEMLPFFAWSIELDPHNVEAILTTAFWLDYSFEKADDAIRVLENGVRDNPDAWEPEYRLGVLLFKKKKDYPSAEAHMRQALKKAHPEEITGDLMVDVYFYVGEACREQGKNAEAAEAYHRALSTLNVSKAAALKKIIEARLTFLTHQV